MGRYRGRHAAAKQTDFGSARLRRGVSSAAIAAAAMAALTASQAPGIGLAQGGGAEGDVPSGSAPDAGPGDDSYHTELPPLATPAPPEEGGEVGPDQSGIPATVLAAYKKAERAISGSDPACNLPWQLLAAIGKVESGQARGGAVDEAGTTFDPILGPQLNGEGFAEIRDTDNGVHDGDAAYDRAVGPMQFIPSTWAKWRADGNGDGRSDPNNIYDAALAAGGYLCAGERDLAVKADLDRAILSYNNSSAYLRTVLSWLEFYRDGVHEVPDGAGPLPTSPGAGGDDGPSSGGSGTGKPSPDPSGGSESPDPDPDPSDDPSDDPSEPGEPTDPTDPTEPAEDVPAALERVGAAEVTVTAGGQHTGGYPVRVTAEDGDPVAQARVRYEIVGDTAARFPRGARIVEVRTDEEGAAAAPALLAGDRAGKFTVVATVVGHGDVRAAEFTTTVAPAPEPEADTLQRVGEGGPVQAPAGTVCPAVQLQATYGGEAAAGVTVTATVLDAAGKPLPAGTGPYFAGEGEAELHTLEVRTDAEGRVMLPDLHAGEQPADYRLRLTTPGGGSLVVTVKVTAAPSTPTPTPTPTPSSSAP
ncbi:lytic transglycosylase domain-containing protein [Streptomyces sp. DSM 42041]|uniref:Lytic transglycosylase domain-containing protein n=1 Tax=Streptomyces hazeniae TaxID=3075538 RepID=A0ABU2NTK0_9ACTN|nr:lytic transglycosylase domain-containing protein [Streptomyces sp. DSM 42041]MDT0379941.1 lytic transglycosylase domain-containing protein [Streptomyces sp. DSM 42041]